MDETITIRSQPHAISTALVRSVTHASYHIGQIVLLAKAYRKEEWQSLSIPRGKSEDFNQKAIANDKPDHYTDRLLEK